MEFKGPLCIYPHTLSPDIGRNRMEFKVYNNYLNIEYAFHIGRNRMEFKV